MCIEYKMTSVLRSLAQPLTKTFVITQSSSEGELGPYVFSESDINNWYSRNTSTVKKVGSLYTIQTSEFVDTLDDLTHTYGNVNGRKSLVDLGKEVVIGNNAESRLVVLRRVRLFADSATGVSDFGPAAGYIVVEVNASDLPTNNGRWIVRVARV